MPRRTWFDRRCFAGRPAAVVVLAMSFASHAAADAYTDAIKGEALKVEAGTAASASTGTDQTSAATDPKAAAFEQELDKQFHGTYLFYQQLPPSNREEIFKAHIGGASIEEVRKMVMDRFQHSR
jgi:hypothetical protein